jgi:hypothetical protein
MRRIFASLLAGTLLPLFWFSAFPGSESYFVNLCNAGTQFAFSGTAGFTPSNGDPKAKLCYIVDNQPGVALQQAALN